MSTHRVADCHLHVLDPVRFPYDPAAPYIPAPHETAPAAALAAVLAAHGVTHALLVGPTSGYGRDNRCLVDALAQGGGRWRGIALAAPEATEAELSALAEAGVVGLHRRARRRACRVVPARRGAPRGDPLPEAAMPDAAGRAGTGSGDRRGRSVHGA